jgi:protein gp37
MLGRPSAWMAPRRVFVNSMCDLFHVKVPDAYLDKVFATMEAESRHTYQVLTKRPERMRRYLRRRYGTSKVPTQIWLGTSVENNDYAWRAEVLRDMDAHVHFLSVEPMIRPVDLVSLDRIQWVIAGGESGRGFRPCDVAWLRELRDRCIALNIPFFFKQWHKKNSGRVLDGRTWDEYPSPVIRREAE